MEMEPQDAPKGDFRGMILLSLGLLAFMLLLSIYGWSQLSPDSQIPIHWGPDGKADGFGGRNMLFLMPAIMAGLVGLFWVLPYIEPRKANLLRSSKAYKAVWGGMMLFEAGLHVVMVAAALGREISMDRYMGVGLGILFIIIGNFMGKVRSNHVFGVRTPWTLSSELAWNKTNRSTGVIFLIYGLVFLIAVPLGWSNLLALSMLVITPLIVVYAFVHSYLIWRKDPDKQPIGRQ